MQNQAAGGIAFSLYQLSWLLISPNEDVEFEIDIQLLSGCFGILRLTIDLRLRGIKIITPLPFPQFFSQNSTLIHLSSLSAFHPFFPDIAIPSSDLPHPPLPHFISNNFILSQFCPFLSQSFNLKHQLISFLCPVFAIFHCTPFFLSLPIKWVRFSIHSFLTVDLTPSIRLKNFNIVVELVLVL